MKDNISIILENKKRVEHLFAAYDPNIGIGSPIDRFELSINRNGGIFLPNIMINEQWMGAFKDEDGNVVHSIEDIVIFSAPEGSSEEDIHNAMASLLRQINHERISKDFEFWCFTCVKITDKESKKQIPFKLNRAQRKVFKGLYNDLKAGAPIRMILLKARQWGGSTMIQLFMAWIQLFWVTRWHSAIVADVEDQARNIRGMFNNMASSHPEDIFKVKLLPFEGSSKNKVVDGRGCVIAIGSMQRPENLRSFDFAMCHFSEIGLWKKTLGKSPEDLVQSIRSTVPNVPLSMVVLESTAKGVGNFFHREWLSAKEKKSKQGYRPEFVAWFEIEMYFKEFEQGHNIDEFINTMSAYEWFQWESGATLQGIYWYREHKANENLDDWRMKSEFPTNDDEAFASTGMRAFSQLYVKQARIFNREPEFIGDVTADATTGKEALSGISFVKNDKGNMWVWEMPDNELRIKHRYVVSMDIGGRSKGADFSVIRVFDRYPILDGGVPEAVLTWRGHLDQDMVVWKAVQIAKIYGNAMLAIESNSLRKELVGSEGDHVITILDEIKDYYDNIYSRSDPEKVREGVPVKYGFHTNVKTKVALIDNLNKILREELYIETDSRVCDEYDTYEIKPNGAYGAVDGSHDDLVMCTAIGLKVSDEIDLPFDLSKETKTTTNTIINEASF